MPFSKVHPPSTIYLYDGGMAKTLNLAQISDYFKKNSVGIEVELREDFVAKYLSKIREEEKVKAVEDLARAIASTKIQNLENPETSTPLIYGEIEYEKRRIMSKEGKSFGILYNGFKLQRVLSSLLSGEELSHKHLHIIFTNRLFGTWDENDRRFHARVSVYGNLSLISTTGIVEAPAKPRQFYMKRQMEADLFTLKEEFKGRFIDYDDPRLTEAMKGYCMQTLFFHMTGDPFCDDKNCRLYNAHWQEEVIHAQLKSEYEFCNAHEEILFSTRGRDV